MATEPTTADIAVAFEAYQEGRLPAICVITGEPTRHLLVQTTPLNGPLTDGTLFGRLTGALQQFAEVADARRPQDTLLGRLPIAADQHKKMLGIRRFWTLMVVVSVAMTLVGALSATVWAPALAGAGVIGAVFSASKRRTWRRDLPKATLNSDRSVVLLENVHQAFADAVMAEQQ